MHMDSKLQVMLKGILLTEEDRVKFYIFPLQNPLLNVCMPSKDHLSIQAIHNHDGY